MTYKVNLEDEFDKAVLSFIKTVYIQSKFNKERLLGLFSEDVIKAVMTTVDETKREVNYETI
ncbi:hypothetical protein [Avibacterium endocarditidis]|uniref:Uncharacterized protein n=1 Tax=Avibacterium endocarditidis TaxID=380674 RepID=A0ABX4ZQZ6_9PAST|nr:hypothetical protein [Avibacterium endocarditidis]POY41886.1 hypothetical protein C3Z13_09205 [Avibacterium endocarditidis]